MTVSVWLFLFSVFSRSPVLCSMCHRIHITLKIALFIEIVVNLVFSRTFSLCINILVNYIYSDAMSLIDMNQSSSIRILIKWLCPKGKKR